MANGGPGDTTGRAPWQATDGSALTVEFSDPIISMLEPDTLSSYQYFDRWRGASHLEPERRLMLAVLQEAVDCYQENIFGRGRKQEQAFKDADDWFFDNNHDWPFSFINICETCDLDPDYFRSGLVRWKERAISEWSKRVENSIHRKPQTKLQQTRRVGLVTCVKPRLRSRRL
jgi:hypothetical protein